MTQPEVSVVIPAHARPNLLSEAVDSVIAQTFESWELIVAEDGEDPRIAACLEGRDARIRHLPAAPLGNPAAARNRALRVARGQLVAFLDHDDLFEPEKLQRFVDVFRARGDVGLAYSDVRLLLADGSLSPPRAERRHLDSEHLLDHLLDDCFLSPSNVVARRTAVERLGGFDESFRWVSEYLLWLRLAASTPAVAVDRPLVRIRRHALGLSTLRESACYRQAIDILEAFAASATLSRPRRRRLRRTQARLHLHLAGVASDPREARREAMLSLRRRPWSAAAWRRLARG